MSDNFPASSKQNGPFMGNRPVLNNQVTTRPGPSANFKQVVVDSGASKPKDPNYNESAEQANSGWQAPPVTRGMCSWQFFLELQFDKFNSYSECDHSLLLFSFLLLLGLKPRALYPTLTPPNFSVEKAEQATATAGKPKSKWNVDYKFPDVDPTPLPECPSSVHYSERELDLIKDIIRYIVQNASPYVTNTNKIKKKKN